MKNKRVKLPKIRVIKGKDFFRGEKSPYWNWNKTNNSNNEGNIREPAIANPDVLAETEIATPSTPQLLVGEAVEHLAGRQKECYLLTMREGKSLAETAEILSIQKGSVQKYRERAIKFITQYCKAAIKSGRV